MDESSKWIKKSQNSIGILLQRKKRSEIIVNGLAKAYSCKKGTCHIIV